MRYQYITILSLAALLSGCGTLTSILGNGANEPQRSSASRATVQEVSAPLISFRRTDAARVLGGVTLNAAQAPISDLLSEIASTTGYSVSYSEGVDPVRKITISFDAVATEDAVRKIAFLAGYAAIIDVPGHTVFIAPSATYTFKIPPNATSALVKSVSTGAPVKLDKFLAELAGSSSQVTVTDVGYVTVRGNAQSLARVTAFMRQFSKDVQPGLQWPADPLTRESL